MQLLCFSAINGAVTIRVNLFELFGRPKEFLHLQLPIPRLGPLSTELFAQWTILHLKTMPRTIWARGLG